MTPNTLNDLCKVMERLRAENKNVGRLAFTLPGIARIEMTFLHGNAWAIEETTMNPYRVPSLERSRAILAAIMLLLAAASYAATGSGWAMLALGVQSVLATWSMHEWWRAIGRRRR